FTVRTAPLDMSSQSTPPKFSAPSIVTVRPLSCLSPPPSVALPASNDPDPETVPPVQARLPAVMSPEPDKLPPDNPSAPPTESTASVSTDSPPLLISSVPIDESLRLTFAPVTSTSPAPLTEPSTKVPPAKFSDASENTL